MTSQDKDLFIGLLYAHRHLWTTFQEYRYLQEHPEVDWQTAHEIYFEETDDVYNSLAEALREDRPIQDKLQTVLTQSKLVDAEIRASLKNRD